MEALWTDGQCARLQLERSGFEPWPWALIVSCSVGKDTLFSECLFPPRCILPTKVMLRASLQWTNILSRPRRGEVGGGGLNTPCRFMLQKPGVLTIYTGKPEIPVGKSNGSRHSVWEASENMGCNMR